MDELLEIAVLGGLRLRRGGVPLGELNLRKADALFVYLACTRQPHSREALADLLWDERAPAQALGSLRMLLTNLRPLLGPYLLITRNTIAFNTEQPYWLDAAALETHLDAAAGGRARGAGPPPAALAELEKGVALYAGPFLQSFYVRESSNFEAWMLHEQERLERRVLAALHALVGAALAAGTYPVGIAHATRLLQLDPLHEETHQHLMHLLALSGQRHAALEQYAACRRLLQTELGIAPAEATTTLYQRILAGEVLPPGGPAPTAVSAGRTPRREQLPVQLTPFVGRAAEVAALVAHLAQPDRRLVTLVGLGGSGKTRLAVQAAPLLDGFPDGLYFVPLAPVADAAFLVPAIADALGYTFSGPVDPQAQLLTYLRDKDLLLVLDSFEHLLDATDLLVAILQAAPGVRLLVTAREPLDLAAEQICDLSGLAVPPPNAGADADQYPAVQLFVQRAQRVQPQFALTPEVTPWVVRICRLVEGLPLGLELAAGWVRGQSCQAIAQELEQSLDVLATTQRDVAPRHRSLRAVFDQSWQRLAAAEQQAFRRLAVFRGGFDDEAARAVAGADLAWSRAVLLALVQQSLLRHTPAGRYELHELLRQYAGEHLAQAAEDAPATRARHGAYYLALAEAATPHLHGVEHGSWLARLELELDNLREALRQAQAGRAGDTLLRLSAALGGFWQLRGHLSEGRAWCEAAVAGADAAPGLPRSQALRWAGVLARQQGDFGAAISRLTAGLDLARALADAGEVSRGLNELGQVYRLRGDYAQARALLEESLALGRAAGDRSGVADSLINLGLVAFGQGDYGAARTLYEEGLALQRALGDRPGIAGTLLHLGNVAYYRGDYPAAWSLYEEALTLGREVGDKPGTAMALHNLGMLAQGRGDYAAARTFLEEDMRLFREMGHKPGIAHSLFTLGQGAYAQGEYGRAQALHDESLAVWREVGDTVGLALTLAERGLVAYQQGEYPLARRSLSESLRLCREQQNKHRAALCLLGIAAVSVAADPQPATARRAVQLVGAAGALLEAIGGMLEPAYRGLYEQMAARTRRQLGGAEFAAELARGRALTWEQALDLALPAAPPESGT